MHMKPVLCVVYVKEHAVHCIDGTIRIIYNFCHRYMHLRWHNHLYLNQIIIINISMQSEWTNSSSPINQETVLQAALPTLLPVIAILMPKSIILLVGHNIPEAKIISCIQQVGERNKMGHTHVSLRGEGGQTKSVSHMTGMFITLARKGMKFVVNIKIKAVFHSWNELGYSECCSTCWDGKYPFQTDLNLPFAVWRHFICLFRYEKAGVQCAFFTFSRRLLSLCTEFQHWQCLSSRKQGSQIAMGVCTVKELPTLQRGVAHDLIWPSWLLPACVYTYKW